MENFPDQKKLPKPPNKEQLEAIGGYILDGMKWNEACVLTGYPEEDMKVLVERDPKIAAFMRKKKIELKHKYLSKVANDPKKADWMLESSFPEEFGKNADIAPPPSVNVLQLIMRDIQGGYDLPTQLLSTVDTLPAGRKEPAPKIHEAEITVDSALS